MVHRQVLNLGQVGPFITTRVHCSYVPSPNPSKFQLLPALTRKMIRTTGGNPSRDGRAHKQETIFLSLPQSLVDLGPKARACTKPARGLAERSTNRSDRGTPLPLHFLKLSAQKPSLSSQQKQKVCFSPFQRICFLDRCPGVSA